MPKSDDEVSVIENDNAAEDDENELRDSADDDEEEEDEEFGDEEAEEDEDYEPKASKSSKSSPKPAASKRAAKRPPADDDADDEPDDKDDDADDKDDEDVDEPPSFAAALGLHRVGSKLPARQQPQQPVQVLNARGMPARIRKRNKLFYDDENIVNDRPLRSSPSKRPAVQQPPAPAPTAAHRSVAKPAASPQKTPSKLMKKRRGVVSRYMKLKEEKLQAEREAKTAATTAAASKSSAVTPTLSPNTAAAAASQLAVAPINPVERKCFERIGLRLRNLLKLPRAHKWVSYEWFYSYIDRPLFAGPNDFQVCLRESFPNLQTRQLTRAEWSHIRSLMGKPRRCSAAFFAEERAELERRRHKIRVLQSTSRKTLADMDYIRNLPAEIPLALPVGTKVTARLRHPQDGIFTGTVAVVDTLTSTYRITFDRPGLGTHAVPDIEILVNEHVEMLPVASVLAQEAQHRLKLSSARKSVNRHDPLLGSEIFNNSKLKALVSGSSNGDADDQPVSNVQKNNGFQLKLLELMIRTRKSLVAKEMKLMRLKNMNSDAELSRSFETAVPDDFQRRYASVVISMEKLNREMQDYLGQIQAFTADLTRDASVAATMVPSYLRERCKELAAETVRKNNATIKDENMLRMITDLATIMWVASNLTADKAQTGDTAGQVNRVLDVCMDESRARLVDASNATALQKNVLVHMRHLEMDLRQGGAAQLGAVHRS